MAAITSAGSGNWDSTTANAPWPSGVVPVSGDTVTIANGHSITVPVGYTAVCGTSPTSNAGTVALQGVSSSGTGVLVVNGTLKWQGPVRQGNATWTVGPGGTLTYDASGAATPATALYAWEIGTNNAQANAKLVFNGTSGSRCTINSVGNVRAGGFGNLTTNWQGGGRIEATFADFGYHGAATSGGDLVKSNLNGSSAKVIFEDCTIDNCGQIEATGPFVTTAGIDPASTFRLRRTKVTNPANTDYAVQVTIGTRALTTGERLIEYCDVAGKVYFGTSNASSVAGEPTGFTIRHNVLRNRGIGTATTNVFNPIEMNGGSVVEWKQNLVFIATGAANPTLQDPNAQLGPGTLSNSYLMRLTVPTANSGNMHPLYFKQPLSSLTLDGWVLQMTVVDTAGDTLNWTTNPTSTVSATVTRCVYLPNAAGDVAGSMVLQQGAVNQTNLTFAFDHNTAACGHVVGTNTQGVGAEAGATWPAGAVASIRSNLLWRSTSGTGEVAHSNTSATVASGAVTAADYNATSNVTGTIYGSPSGQYATTPGTHDVAASPQFVDSTRSLLTFDQGYSGASVGTAWATGTAYSVGDVASNSNASFFGSRVCNWRCIQAHTSAATSEPAAGGTYPQYWEPAALSLISASVIAGTTYSAGANSLVGELVSWTKAGFAPTNATLRNAGHDGVTIGAVEGVFGSIPRLSLLGVG